MSINKTLILIYVKIFQMIKINVIWHKYLTLLLVSLVDLLKSLYAIFKYTYIIYVYYMSRQWFIYDLSFHSAIVYSHRSK